MKRKPSSKWKRKKNKLNRKRELEAIAEDYRKALKQGRGLDLEYRERLKRDL